MAHTDIYISRNEAQASLSNCLIKYSSEIFSLFVARDEIKVQMATAVTILQPLRAGEKAYKKLLHTNVCLRFGPRG